MRSFIICIIVMIILIFSISLNSNLIQNKFETFSNLLDTLPQNANNITEENYQKHLETLKEACYKWKSTITFAEFTISHDEIDKFTDSLLSTYSFFDSKSFPDYFSYLQLAKESLTHLIDHESLSLKEIS